MARLNNQRVFIIAVVARWWTFHHTCRSHPPASAKPLEYHLPLTDPSCQRKSKTFVQFWVLQFSGSTSEYFFCLWSAGLFRWLLKKITFSMEYEQYKLIDSVSSWVWVNTYRYIFSGMNIHLPAILGFTRYQGFDPSPYVGAPLKRQLVGICL